MINSTAGLKKAGMLTIRIPKMANPLKESTKSILLDWDKGASVSIVLFFGLWLNFPKVQNFGNLLNLRLQCKQSLFNYMITGIDIQCFLVILDGIHSVSLHQKAFCIAIPYILAMWMHARI